ncbi:MAG: transposase [Bacillota bacterium]
MPDEALMRLLEKERGFGRDDYQVRGMWNATLAGIVYQHPSVESLIRELSRNGQLRQMCGLDKVPTTWAFSRFLSKLMDMEEEIDAIFNRLIDELKVLLPDFGENLAVDGKKIPTHANPHKDDKLADGRRDTDADFGKKVYRGKREDGTMWEKVVSWFGYRLHLIVDSLYELPVSYIVTKASCGEAPRAHELLDQLEEVHPEILDRCKYFSGDRGYDGSKLIVRLWDQHHIKPLIDIRNMWQDEDKTRLVKGKENVVYDYCGTVYCYCPKSGDRRQMGYGGFEQDRNTLKYRCPAEHYGISCQGKKECPAAGAIRIPLKEDRRIFTPVARGSYKFEDLYDMRTAVERVNSRLDVSFGFEKHYIRGLKKMQMRVGLALCVMPAMAAGRIKENQMEKMRSLVKAA